MKSINEIGVGELQDLQYVSLDDLKTLMELLDYRQKAVMELNDADTMRFVSKIGKVRFLPVREEDERKFYDKIRTINERIKDVLKLYV